ncbi:hypothetical protein GGR65_001354 [Xanthomonas sp. 3376]|nr:hypothetical protein [Xanthomonas arboricola]
MATLIPSRSSSAGRMTSGERRFSQRLEDKLDDEYICWYDVPIGPSHRHPDFIVLHPYRGILVLEVKDWKLETIAEIDRDTAVLHTERGREVTSNPLRQARDICIEVGKLMLKDAALRLPEGSKYQGKLIMPWGFGVVFSNISRAQFDEAELGNVIAAGSVICRDEMTESVDTEAFQKRLWDMFPATFSCQLSLPQIERIRWHLFPQLRIVPPEQVQLFASPQPDKPIAIPDLIKVMDLQQEQLARSMGDGHRVIHGVAGSGKTMILGYRCVEIAKRQGKPVLVLCYNKTLAGRLEHIIHAHGVQDRVSVRHFHGWCGEQLKAYGIKPPPAQPNAQQYLDALVSKVISAVESQQIPRAQYAAVMIDEGHDFAPEWLQIVTQMVDPETNSLLLLYDDAQTIYSTGGRRKFSFASVGIQAKGRTTILRLNYRNTLEILSTAKAFAQELLAGEDADEDNVPVIAPESAGRRGAVPELIQASSVWEESRIIAQQVREALNNGASANDFAVLCRNKVLATHIASRLRTAELPVVLAEEINKRNLFDGEPSVKVLTMHSSKGLEFESVFIPGICEIGQRLQADSEEMRQEAKLLYVAMTRALGSLTMLHHSETILTERIGQAIDQIRTRIAA